MALVYHLPGRKRQVWQRIEPHRFAREALIFELPTRWLGRWRAIVAALGPVELPRRELQEGGRVEGLFARVVGDRIRVADAPIVWPTVQVGEAPQPTCSMRYSIGALIVEAIADLAAGRLPGGVEDGALRL